MLGLQQLTTNHLKVLQLYMPYIINNETGAGKVTTIELWPYNSLKPKGFAFFLGITFALIALPLFNVLGTKVFWGIVPIPVFNFDRNLVCFKKKP